MNSCRSVQTVEALWLRCVVRNRSRIPGLKHVQVAMSEIQGIYPQVA